MNGPFSVKLFISHSMKSFVQAGKNSFRAVLFSLFSLARRFHFEHHFGYGYPRPLECNNEQTQRAEK